MRKIRRGFLATAVTAISAGCLGTVENLTGDDADDEIGDLRYLQLRNDDTDPHEIDLEIRDTADERGFQVGAQLSAEYEGRV
jgi:hypothetical protein